MYGISSVSGNKELLYLSLSRVCLFCQDFKRNWKMRYEQKPFCVMGLHFGPEATNLIAISSEVPVDLINN